MTPMNRNWLLAHWRRMAMQGVLCAVLGLTIGLAALTVHQKRLALRLPLGAQTHIGRLYGAVPKGWLTIGSEESAAGDALVVEEMLPDGIPGRRLTLHRLRTTGLVSPLEELLRTTDPRDLDFSEAAGARSALPKLQKMEMAGWPGVMVTCALNPLGGRRVHKLVLACAVLPPGQAVVIRLVGQGEPDVADEELIREIAETVSVHEGTNPITRPESGGTVELGGGVFAPVPDHFCKLPADINRTSRDLLADGYQGGWTSIELIPCLWLPGDGEQAFLSLLAARDREWRSGAVKTLDDGVWQVDRADPASPFPSRAYCMTDGGEQAILAIMHGGPHEDQLFDPAWKAISANVRFTMPKDLSTLLKNGKEQVERLVEVGGDQLISPQGGRQEWALWDQAENTDKQSWMTLEWKPKDPPAIDAGTKGNIDATDAAIAEKAEPAVQWMGSRVITLDRGMAARSTAPLPYIYGVEQMTYENHQFWSGTSDFTEYKLFVDQNAYSHGKLLHSMPMQRLELRQGKLRNLVAGDEPRAVPPQYIPGAWLPLFLGKLSEKQMVLRTESFIGCDGASQPELLTLHINHVTGGPMRCITVSVNGTGKLTRWWYDLDGTLRYIDFAGALRAQRNDGGAMPRQAE